MPVGLQSLYLVREATYPFIWRAGDSLQTKWVRYTIGRYLERVNAGKAPGDLVLPSADTCALFARAARHAHWLVQVRGERSRGGGEEVKTIAGVSRLHFAAAGVAPGLSQPLLPDLCACFCEVT